jgi:hypothetical protein
MSFCLPDKYSKVPHTSASTVDPRPSSTLSKPIDQSGLIWGFEKSRYIDVQCADYEIVASLYPSVLEVETVFIIHAGESGSPISRFPAAELHQHSDQIVPIDL